MRRAVPVLVATGGTLVLLANFHTSPAPSGVVAGESPTRAEEAATAAPPSTLSANLPVQPLATTTTLVATTTTATTTTTVRANALDGPVETNKWGPVQVRVMFDGGQITDVQPLRMPDDNSHSAALSRAVARKLKEEALQTQSAKIDIVSGATLTSQNYIDSLQGALDKASG